MADLEKFFSKFRLVRKRSRKLTVIMLIVAIVLSIGALSALHLSMIVLRNRTEALRQQAAQLTLENEDLQQDIDQAGSMQAIVEIAQEELGLVPPDAIFYVPES